MARTWLSIRIDMVEGHGEHLWPRPGRTFAAARSNTFAQLARATYALAEIGPISTPVTKSMDAGYGYGVPVA